MHSRLLDFQIQILRFSVLRENCQKIRAFFVVTHKIELALASLGSRFRIGANGWLSLKHRNHLTDSQRIARKSPEAVLHPL
jgi:hypothetical protein